MDKTGLAAVLASAGIAPEALIPEISADSAPSDEPAWWDWKLRGEVTVAEGRLPLLPFVTLRVAPAKEGPDRWTVYLWAFQT